MLKSAKKELKWSETDIIYQIYPLSFKDTTANGKGDLQGIIDKLDYLNDNTEKSLGIDAVWLGPIYKTPMKDFGYDVSDYYKIEPVLGSFKLFSKLISQAHKRNIKILLDFVPNHTSDQHDWFLQSRSSKKNPKRNWYIWQDPKPDGSPPNNWLSRFGGSAWEFDKKTGQYYLHTFLKSQPDLNWRNPSVVREMTKILSFWLDKGVDGFRLDAVYHVVKDDKFRNNPINPRYIPGQDDPYRQYLNVYDRGRPETLDVLKKICQTVGQYKNKFLVSEVFYKTKVSEISKYYDICKKADHAPFNFNFIRLEWNASDYRSFINNYLQKLDEDDWPNYVLGNHDRKRAASRLKSRKKARLAAIITLTLKGMPFIYYGEEIGMSNVPVKKDQQKDLWGRQVPGLDLGRDGQRTPMQWTAGKYAGFSQIKPWLPIARNYKQFNVKIELKEHKSMLNMYKKIIWFRKNSPALQNGIYYPLNTGNKNIFAYIREAPEQKILIIINFSGQKQKISLPFAKSKLVCSSFLSRKPGQILNLNNIYLKSYQGLIFELLK